MNLSILNNADYKSWLIQLKHRISSAQLKAAAKVNEELLSLYWQLGKEITAKQAQSTWGDALVDQLSKDLSAEFPEMKGFSRTNLFYVRKWFLFYNPSDQKVPPPVGQTDLHEDDNKVPQLVGQIPWGHNREIITKTNNIAEALFYVRETIRNNWSRNVLLEQIKSNLYARQGNALNNFDHTLAKPQADLARETLKNPYNLDFLSIGPEAQERDLEQALADQMTKFILELGQGFAYKGKQYHLNVGEDDFYIDLLFYHTSLRCHVVIELKVTDFQPEFAGKLNFYLNAIDEQLKHPDDQPSIGILLCKTPNKIVVEYALKNISKPLGVSEYQFIHAIPENLKGELPTIEELEQELEKEIELPLKPLDKKLQQMNALLASLNEEEVSQVKTPEIVKHIFDSSLQKLEKIFSQKSKSITGLFSDVTFTYRVGNTGYYNLDEALQQFQKNVSIYNFGLDYSFNGFKKLGTNAFGANSSIEFGLGDYSYSIGKNREDLIFKKLYHQELSENELNHMAENMLVQLLDRINAELERANPNNLQ